MSSSDVFCPHGRYSSLDILLANVFLKKNQDAPRPSEHPPVREGKMSKRLGGIIG